MASTDTDLTTEISMGNSTHPPSSTSTREPRSEMDGWLDEIGYLAYEANRAAGGIPFTPPEAFVEYTRKLAAAVGALLGLVRRQPVDPAPSSPLVDRLVVAGGARGVEEIRALCAARDLVPSLLDEIDRLENAELRAEVERVDAIKRDRARLIAELAAVRGVVQAVEALAESADMVLRCHRGRTVRVGTKTHGGENEYQAWCPVCHVQSPCRTERLLTDFAAALADPVGLPTEPQED